MKNTTTPTYSFYKSEDKYYFAGFLNNAQLNIEFTLKELARRLHLKYSNARDIINRAFPGELSLSDQNTRLDFLSESFRFVPLLKLKEDPEDESKHIPRSIEEIKSLLIELIDFTSQLRHYYTHFDHKQPQFSKELSHLLEHILFMAAKNIRNRVRTEEYKMHLENKYSDKIMEYVREENKKRTYKKRIKEGQEIGFVLNNAFSRYLHIENGIVSKKENLSCTYQNWISQNGFMLLLSLFLNNKQLSGIFSHVSGFKGTQHLTFQLTHWIFTYYSYKDIKKLFKSDYTNDSLMLQMIEELSRCPKHLYPYLSSQKKQEFFEGINAYYQEFEGRDKSPEESLVEHEVIKKRYENKFPYFAIRFLDEYANFPSLRFGIHFGKYNHQSTTKEFKGVSYTTERKILERIQVFDKLSKLNKIKNEYFAKKEDSESQDGWLEFPNPSYQITHNNIPIWLKMGDNTETEAPARPSGKPSKHKLLKEFGLENSLKKPVAFLSINELPALLYELLIKENSGEKIEQKIKNKIYEQIRLIENSEDAGHTDKKRMPRALIKSLKHDKPANNQIDLEKLKKDIKEELKYDPLKTTRLAYNRKKARNNHFLTNSEKGAIATYLSKDIIRFAPAEKRKDIKGYQFAEFQQLLAFYDSRKDQLTDFIKLDLGINFRKSSFKIKDCFSKKTLCYFYNEYLKKRKSHLQNFLHILENNPESIQPEHEIFNGFKLRKYQLRPANKYKEALLKQPVNLPRGIFDNKPTAYYKDQPKPDLAEWYQFCNRPGEAQEFYSYKKYYPVPISEADKRKQDQQEICPAKGIKEQLKQAKSKEDKDFIYKNEEQINKTLRNDFFILEMVRHCFKIETNSEVNLSLKSVFINKATQKAIEQRAKESGEINDGHILSARKEMQIPFEDKRIIANVAIKSIGKLQKLKNDPRIGELLQYYPHKKDWSKDEVMDELSEYDKVRSEFIFKAVHDLERRIYAKAENNNKLALLMQNGHPNFKLYLAYYFIDNLEDREAFCQLELDKIRIGHPQIVNRKNLYLLAKIRNKFAHNQFLPLEDFQYLQSIIPMKEEEKTAFYIYRCFEILAETEGK